MIGNKGEQSGDLGVLPKPKGSLMTVGLAAFVFGATFLGTGNAKAAAEETNQWINPLANTTSAVVKDNGKSSMVAESFLKDASNFLTDPLSNPGLGPLLSTFKIFLNKPPGSS